LWQECHLSKNVILDQADPCNSHCVYSRGFGIVSFSEIYINFYMYPLWWQWSSLATLYFAYLIVYISVVYVYHTLCLTILLYFRISGKCSRNPFAIFSQRQLQALLTRLYYPHRSSWCTPALGTLPPQLQTEWNRILYSSSIRLINNLSVHCESTLTSLKEDIDKLYRKLQASCLDAELIKYTNEINEFYLGGKLNL
jgi:hypothetical protein